VENVSDRSCRVWRRKKDGDISLFSNTGAKAM